MITPEFAAYAVVADVHMHNATPSPELDRRIEGMLTKIAQGCVEEGAELIGHIKCMVETEGRGFLAVSVVDASGQPRTRGRLEDGIEDMRVIVNVLLYGLRRSKVQGIVDPLLRQELAFPGGSLTMTELGTQEHDHDHKHRHEHDHGDEDGHDHR